MVFIRMLYGWRMPHRRLFHFFFPLHFLSSTLVPSLPPILDLLVHYFCVSLSSFLLRIISSSFHFIPLLLPFVKHSSNHVYGKRVSSDLETRGLEDFRAVWIRMDKNKYDNTLRVWYRTILVDNLIQQIPTKSFSKGSEFLLCFLLLRFLLLFY